MAYIKKLTFAPVFLILFALTNYLLAPLLKSPLTLLPTDLQGLIGLSIQLFILIAVLLLGNLFFVVFVSLAQNLSLIVPVALLGSLYPLFFIPTPLSYVLTGGFLTGVFITYPMLSGKLKNYLTFQPAIILIPSIKNLTIFMILVISFASYLALNVEVQKNGFKIPDSLIDSVLKIIPSSGVGGGENIAQLPQLTQEQIDLLKQQPELLKQYGIDPKILDQTSQTAANPAASLIKDQIQKLITPFIPGIPAIIAITLFLILFFNEWTLSLFLPPIIWLIFWILEKSGFITFQKEMREVKKMVV